MNLLNRLVVAAIPLVPKSIVRIFASRYIAGETIADAIRCVRQLNREGVCATLDVLGEDITNNNEAVLSRSQSIEVLHTIAKEKLDSNLSIKLTSLGLKLGKDICTANVERYSTSPDSTAHLSGSIWEDSSCTSDTIRYFPDHPEGLSQHWHCAAVVHAPLGRRCEGVDGEQDQLPVVQGHLQGAA